MIPEHLRCQTLVEEITEWMDGGLDARQRAELELHLVTCVGCTAYLAQLRQVSETLAAAAEEGEAGPSDEVRSNLMALFRQRRPTDSGS